MYECMYILHIYICIDVHIYTYMCSTVLMEAREMCAYDPGSAPPPPPMVPPPPTSVVWCGCGLLPPPPLWCGVVWCGCGLLPPSLWCGVVRVGVGFGGSPPSPCGVVWVGWFPPAFLDLLGVFGKPMLMMILMMMMMTIIMIINITIILGFLWLVVGYLLPTCLLTIIALLTVGARSL